MSVFKPTSPNEMYEYLRTHHYTELKFESPYTKYSVENDSESHDTVQTAFASFVMSSGRLSRQSPPRDGIFPVFVEVFNQKDLILSGKWSIQTVEKKLVVTRNK